MKKTPSGKHLDKVIYTLGQSETGIAGNYGVESILVFGNGTALSNNKAVKNRAKKKLISTRTIMALIKIAEEKGAKDRLKAYWNTYHCMNRVISANGRLYGNYCKNRFCTTCC